MPTTATATARTMGLTWRSTDIWDPASNLKVGAYFLDTLHKRYRGNSALALAAYNAGPGNADRWLAENPGAPTDVVVEAIDFRETRQYVKRVSSTWQTYRLLYGTDALYPDLTPFMDRAVP
jgi:soluble lytic murein transglycosylase